MYPTSEGRITWVGYLTFVDKDGRRCLLELKSWYLRCLRRDYEELKDKIKERGGQVLSFYPKAVEHEWWEVEFVTHTTREDGSVLPVRHRSVMNSTPAEALVYFNEARAEALEEGSPIHESFLRGPNGACVPLA